MDRYLGWPLYHQWGQWRPSNWQPSLLQGLPMQLTWRLFLFSVYKVFQALYFICKSFTFSGLFQYDGFMWCKNFIASHFLRPGTRPTNGILIECEIRPKFAVLWFAKKFCTCHNSVTVVTCAKFCCDWLNMLWTRALQISLNLECDLNIVSGTGTWWFIYVSELGHHRFRLWHVAHSGSAPSHYLIQCWHIADCIPRKELPWKYNHLWTNAKFCQFCLTEQTSVKF